MGMRRVVINADDMGIDVPRNRGIVECHRRGVLTSVSLLAEAPAASDAAARLAECPGLGVGLHLDLTRTPRWGGKRGVWEAARAGHLDLDAAGEALLRQGEAFHALVGRSPTHLDGHNHVQVYPGLADLVCRVARRLGVRAVRVPEEPAPREGWGRAGWHPSCEAFTLEDLARLAREARPIYRRAGLASTDHFRGGRELNRLDEDALLALLDGLPEGTTEVMTHPGYADPTSVPFSGPDREREVAALTAPAVREVVRSRGLELVHWGAIAG